MSNQHSPFTTVMPRIFCADGQEKTVIIQPRQKHIRDLLDQVRLIRVSPYEDPVKGTARWYHTIPPAGFRRSEETGALTVTFETSMEGEYTIWLGREDEKGEAVEITAFQIYAVREDLFRLMPYKGDFHMHSNCSDGREAPEFVAAFCRKSGCDFMALTDHKKYEPSLVARRAMADFGCDMLVCPGEEVHLPDNPVHIINFGAGSSINRRAYDDEEKYRAEVREYEKSIPEKYDPETRFQTAASEWAFDRIREAGGISMFCHPYWRPRYHNFIGEDVIELLMERNKFDVLEVIGGYMPNATESNFMAVTRWQEELGKGKTIPVAGVSDSHGCNSLAGWYYSVIFAEELSFDSLAAAIRANRSVAVHWLPNSFPVAVGPFRLVRFVYFLLRELYPFHDDLCRIEGEIMLRALSGEEPFAAAQIAARKGSVRRFMEQSWGLAPFPAV